jgi:hypothetical protein
MKISEFIEELERLKQKHGDLDVYHNDPDNIYEAHLSFPYKIFGKIKSYPENEQVRIDYILIDA